MATIPVTFELADAALPFGTPIEDVLVRVYDTTGATFVTEALTDPSGQLILLLEDMTTFWVRFFKVGFSFDPRLLITTDSTASSNTFDVVGNDLTELPPSAVQGLCRVSGEVIGAHGAPVAGVTFSFTVTDLPRVHAGRAITASKVYARSNADGYIEVELIQDGAYDVLAEGAEDETIQIKVPRKQACPLAELVWPFVAILKFDPIGPLMIAVGETVEVQPTVVLSSGVETPYTLDEDELIRFGYWIDLKIDNDAIARITVDDKSDKMTITGSAPGTVTVTATVRQKKEANRIPEPVRDMQTLTVIVS